MGEPNDNRPLESALNEFAVIRTTFEALDYFPDDEMMRAELMPILEDARQKLIAKLAAMMEAGGRFHEPGYTDLAELQSYLVEIMERGIPGRNLDSMMRLDSFGRMGQYQYFFRDGLKADQARDLPPAVFMRRVFADLLAEAEDQDNYLSRAHFEHVFRKYTTVMFCVHASTDPLFYRLP